MKVYPLLQSQLGLFMEWMEEPSMTRYNLSIVVPFSKKVSFDKLEQAFYTIIEARPVLRTRFVLDEEGIPCQYSDPDMVIPIRRYQKSEEEIRRYIADGFIRPYDLLVGEPLLRIELVDTPEHNYLLVDLHHVIGDGLTLATNLSIKDTPAAYNGEPLAEIPYGMYEYAEDEQACFGSEAYERSKQYYAEKFAGMEFTRLSVMPANPIGNSIHEDAYISAPLVDEWCEQHGTSSNLLFMAAFSYVLSVSSREEQVAYSCINHGRMNKRLMNAYGMFVKSTPVLVNADREQAVIDFVKGLRRELMSTIRYGNYPFNHFCQDLKMTPGVEFGFQGVAIQEYTVLEGEKTYAIQLDRGRSASNLTCIIYLTGNQYDIRLTSSDAINNRKDLERISKAIKATVFNMMANPEAPLSGLSMMDDEERSRIETFRVVARAEVPYKLFHEPIERNAITYADRTALVANDRTLTFREFNEEANRVAHALIRKGVRLGDRVVLLLPRSSAVIVSMFAVSKAGAAYIPCDPAYPAERIRLIMTDSEAQYVITTKEYLTGYPADKVIDIDEIYGAAACPLAGDDENPGVEISPEDLAYLIYTSGSTGCPKGVMLRHIGITNYLYDHPANVHIHGLVELDVKSFVSITTLSFDMSLKEFAGSLFNGITSIFADEQEVMDASLLAELMRRTGAEAINGTCSRLLSYMELPAFCEALAHCKAVWAGGEKYPTQLLTALQGLGVQVYNTYGPTEVTVSSNIKNLTHSKKVTVGRPLLNYEEFIVDPYGNELPVGFTGELLIGGPGVARGYNNLPEMTAERFVDYQGIRVYRSGDLARWEADGDVDILGRNDGQVKLRGFRIELGEVENLATIYEEVRQAVADVKEIGTVQHLCLYYTSGQPVDEDALKAFLASSLTEYMVPTVYIRMDAIPLTPNGKTNRKALPVPVLQLGHIVPPETEMERKIFDLVAEILQISDFGVTNDLVSLGLSSLASMRLSAVLKKRLDVQILMKDIMRQPTVRALAELSARSSDAGEQSASLTAYPKRAWYPMSESQRGMYVDWLMNPDALQYNIPVLLHFRGIDTERLGNALRAVADAHPYMKVRLALQGDDVVQMRHDDAPVEISEEILAEMPDRAFFQSRIRPFDLLNEPLYRFNICRFRDHVYLLLDLHHIISDGSSNYIIARELEKAYRGEALVPEDYTAYDRALDEEALMQTDRGPEAEAYFDALVGGLEATVYPNSTSVEGDRKQDVVDVYITSEGIDAFCKKHALAVSGYFLTTFHQVLYRITREDNVLIYFISNGRSELLLDNFFGVLVKTLPSVQSRFTGPMVDLVRAAGLQMQETIRNDFYPFTKLVERHDLKAEILYNYFVDLQTDVVLDGRPSEEIYGLDWDMAKTPLSITMLRAEDGVGYIARIEYDATRYNQPDMRVLANAFKAFAENGCSLSCYDVAKAPVVSQEEQARLLTLSQGEKLEYDANDTFISLFTRRAAQAPDSPAVVDATGTYTYKELDRFSDSLAAELISLGVGASGAGSPFVSIMLDYQKEFLVAAIGIQKAGGAYVPLDYEYPNDRLLYMLEDSESQVLITSHEVLDEKTAEGDRFTAKNILFIDDFLKEATEVPAPVNRATPEGIAYMIYTSGSTGKPKGVMIPHRAKVNFIRFIAKEWRLSEKSRICCHSSFSFDASIEDLYPVLTVGGTLFTIDKDVRKDMVQLQHFLLRNQITGGCYTTQLGVMLLQQYSDLPLDYLVVGGEKMAANPTCAARLINTYGPTEFTVDATYFEVEKGKDYKNIPIGRPLYNLAAYVVDPQGLLVPQGVAGELCMAGPQMAAGYWKQEALTAEKFTDCAFAAGKIYHTGDLVKYNEEGQIEYLGRIDNQIKLRGFRIELGEIETLISKYEGIQMQSVQVREVGGVQHLCAYYTGDGPVDENRLRAYLAGLLTDYMVPSVYIQLDEMPLTPNGKVNAKALPLPTVQSEEMATPASETERRLFGMASEMLKSDRFGVTTNLLSLGLTSLAAMRFTIAVHQQLGVNVSVKEIMQHPTIHQLAALVDRQSEKPLSSDESDNRLWPYGKHYYYPIAENQRGVLLDWELNKNTTQYNVPEVHRMEGMDVEKLCDALVAVVNSHPYLKTRLVRHEGDIMQIRRDEEPAEVLVRQLDEEPTAIFFQARVRPFDLYSDTLYRLEIYTYDRKVYLFMDFHHIIYDGASSLFFLEDLRRMCQGKPVVKEVYTAFDRALDELRLTKSEQYVEAEDYFGQLLSGVETTVYPHSVALTNSLVNQSVKITLPSGPIKDYCNTNAVTASNFFLTALMQILHRVTREENVLITTINNGRSDVRMMGIMGMFVKTLPVVSAITPKDGGADIAGAIRKIQEQVIESQSRDFYPFTRMVELHGIRPEIMYAFQGGLGEDQSAILDMQEIRLTLDTAKLPLSVTVIEQGPADYQIELDYVSTLYSYEDMKLLAKMLKNVSSHMLSGGDLALLDKEEEEAVIRLSTGEKVDVDYSKTFVDLFTEKARSIPDRIAVVDVDSQYTYAGLDRMSDKLAYLLVEAGVCPDEFVCVLMERRKEFVLCVLGVHKAGAAYTPLDIDYPADRLRFMMENSGTKVLLTSHEALDAKRLDDRFVIDDPRIRIIYVDDLQLEEGAVEPINRATPDSLAYMIYTSGSTGVPKGAMLHQKGLLNFTISDIAISGLTADDRIACHRAFSFDAHIGDVFPVLTVGGELHIMPSSLRKDMRQIVDFIVGRKITGVGFTTSLMMLLMQNFDLPLRFITAGGEKLAGVKSDHIRIINLYGPTECTNGSSFFAIEPGQEYANIPIGRPQPNMYCFVVDPDGQLLPQGLAGELCVAGVQVGRGYWGLPEMTRQVFTDCPFLPTNPDGSLVPMYHTNDFVRYNLSGELEYIGRLDGQVKLRGFRIEIGEIESVALTCPGVEHAAAKVCEVNGMGRLVLYFTVHNDEVVGTEQLRAHMEASGLAEYMRPEIYMSLESMPQLPNGKKNRKALPLPELVVENRVVAETELEQQLLDIVAEVLKFDQLGVTTNLISAGLTSLVAMRLSAIIQQKLGLYVQTKDILAKPTIRQIAKLAVHETGQEAREWERRAYYPITENQRGVYIDWEMNRNTTQYNLPAVERMDGKDAVLLRDALAKVVRAHPYLKTRLAMKDGDVVQLRLDQEPEVIDIVELEKEPNVEFFKARVRPFDLFNDRLYRLEIIKTPSTLYLFQDIHHLIFDGASGFIFAQDLEKAYAGELVPTETYTSFEHALDEQELMRSAVFTEAETYFDTMLSDTGMIAYPHSDVADGTGITKNGYVDIEIPQKTVDTYCHTHAVTANNFFLTVLMQVLHRLTREERIAITTISNGRSDLRMHTIMGMFVKTLPVVSRQGVTDSFAEALTAMHKQSVQSQAYDIYPFTRLAQRYKFHPEIMYVFQGGLDTATLHTRTDEMTVDLDTTKVPVAISVIQMDNGNYRINMEYDTSLYAKADMRLLAEAMRNFALAVLGVSDSISFIPMVSEAEQMELLSLSRGEELSYDKNETFVDMVVRQAVIRPEAVALIDQEGRMSYGRLDALSDAFAARLIGLGVKPGTFVGIMLPRRKEFIVALLGVMKAGAAYVPMDSEYPTDRLLYMLEDSQAKVLVTTRELYACKQQEGDFNAETVLFTEEGLEEVPAVNLTNPDGLAYMIYTSGSTGKPKGVMLAHRALRAFLTWRLAKIRITSDSQNAAFTSFSFDSRNAALASFSFDASLDDLLCPLAAGGRVYILPENLQKDMDGIYGYLKENHITGMTISTALGMALLGQYPDLPLRYMMMGGEKMLPFPKTPMTVINGYGPTEFSVCSSYHIVDQGNDFNIPIGRPVPNSYSFVCDCYGNLLPRGAAGELCLCGEQIALGYWHREDLTKEKFRETPFGFKVYRTGDLARWNTQGELEFLGRIDNQVKLRGFRIELGEIENQASLFEGMKAVVAEVREVAGSKHLVLYFTAEYAVEVEALREHLAFSLAEYMVPDTYMQLEELPWTPNGKVNRRALPEPIIRSAAEFVEPENDTERLVARLFQEVLNLNQPVGALDSFFALGGDSIKSIRLVSKFRSEGMNIQVAEIMKLKVVRSIAAAVVMDSVVEIDQAAWSGEVPQSAITEFFFDLELPRRHHFNQTMFIKANERMRTDWLKRTLSALVAYHDMLRTIVRNDRLYVRSTEEPNLFGFEELDYSSEANYKEKIECICKKRQQSINLERGPLFKAILFHAPSYDALLLVCHHLIVDGISWRILLADFNTAYMQAMEGKEISLQAKTHSYKEYAETLQRFASSYDLTQEIPYWDAVQKKVMNLPNSNVKDYGRTFADINMELDIRTTHKIVTDAGAPYHADVNDLLMTALGRSYYKLTGNRAVSVQFEGHGREYIGSNTLLTDRTIGWFTSVYPVVLEHLDGDMRSCLRTIKEVMHRIPNKGVGYNILRFFNDTVNYSTDKVALIGFNYLGEMDNEEDGDKRFTAMTELASGPDFAVENVFGPSLSINSSVVDGRLKSNLAYDTALFTENQALELMGGMMSELRGIVAHTEKVAIEEMTATDLGETEWTDEEFQTVYSHFEKMGTPIERIYPLSPMQEGIMLKFIMEPDSLAYRLVSRMSLDILPTVSQLRYALDQLAAKHEVLRTSIIYRDVEQYRQAIINRPLALDMKDISASADVEATMMNMYRAEQQHGFDMEDDALFRIVCVKTSDSTCEMLLSVHHIIVDGWCIGLFTQTFVSALAEAVLGTMRPIERCDAGRYERFIREILKKNHEEGLGYWKNLLQGYTTKAVIHSMGLVPEHERVHDNMRVDIIGEDMSLLQALAASEQVTLNTIVELAWAIVLQVYNRQDDVVFVKVVSGRNNASESVEDVVGLFINSVPVRVKLENGQSIRQALRALQKQAAESNEWDFCPLAEIQRQSELGSGLFQSIVAFENYDSGNDEANDALPFHLRMLYSKEESINDITVTAYAERDTCLKINLGFDNTRYRGEEIERVLLVMKFILQAIGRQPDGDVCKLAPLSPEAAVELIKLGKGESLVYDKTKTLVDLFTDQARLTPDSVCVVYKDRRLTFREVDRITDRLAILLQKEYDIRPEMVVGVMIDRSELMLVYPLAIMKAGAAYMPLDFHFPSDRLAFMCRDAGVTLILSENNRVREAMPDYPGKVILSEILRELDSASGELKVDYKAGPGNMFVVLYTSGSTGIPKGVVLEHRNIVNFCHWYIKEFDVTDKDRSVAYANFGFDAHMMDLYPAISVGGSAYVISSEMRTDLMAMNEYMEQESLSLAFLTTQVGYMFATTIGNKSLRLLSVGGEKLQPLAKPDFRFYNGYGPTECTLFSTCYAIDRDYDSSYIGRPLAGYQLFVVDQNRNMLPCGAAGELVVAGIGVGRGYLNRPELNAEKFITYMGQPAYCTGDLVRWSPDGNIEFLGRIDNQVKLRGLRIEMGEIEACVSKYPDISSATVDVKEIAGAQYICCYFTAGVVVGLDSLRDYLAERLADYMVPSAYIQMDTMPLTPNGKVNKRALPIPELSTQTENMEPETEKEKCLYDIACELLKTDQFGVTDDLTRVGLTSLLGIKFVMMAAKQDITIKLDDLMKLRSIRAILEHNMSMAFWVNTYSSDKPVVVVVCGATPYKDMNPYVNELCKNYSVFAFEAIIEHYNAIFVDADINEVVEMYFTLLDLYIEPKVPIAAFTGHCFGGEIAYRLAIRRKAEYGGYAPMLMLDVFWRVERMVFDENELTGLIPQHLIDKHGGAIRSYTKALRMYDNLGREGVPPVYDGEVALYRAEQEEPINSVLEEIYKEAPEFEKAWKHVTMERGMDNAAFWSQYYPDMKIYDVPAHHMSMLEKQYVVDYVKWIDEHINKTIK